MDIPGNLLKNAYLKVPTKTDLIRISEHGAYEVAFLKSSIVILMFNSLRISGLDSPWRSTASTMPRLIKLDFIFEISVTWSWGLSHSERVFLKMQCLRLRETLFSVSSHTSNSTEVIWEIQDQTITQWQWPEEADLVGDQP